MDFARIVAHVGAAIAILFILYGLVRPDFVSLAIGAVVAVVCFKEFLKT